MDTSGYFDQCAPITSVDNISNVLNHPPEWIRHILPLTKRSGSVVKNHIADCHVEGDNFQLNQRFDKRFVPKTLVCHDYKGGYLEDKYSVGRNIGNQYTFYNWSHIDIFVYFSHHLITIPPLCWINAAHKDGVKILGTFITEFDNGRKTCERILKDDYAMKVFVTSLVKLTEIFQFDGWLLNIENTLDNTGILKRFVSHLTNSLHQINPDSLIIWYDSITEKGELKWQNELNQSNRCFFDSCDGIFLNYVWTEEKLISSAKLARHRLADVYVGVDIFGRNTFAGGQFNSYEAAEMIRKHRLSMAIFAPGWTHETLPKTETIFRDFINRDSAFWNSLWPFLYTHPITGPFTTFFYLGSDKNFYNIHSQQRQLSRIRHPTTVHLEYSNVPTLKSTCSCLQSDFNSDDQLKCLITKEYLNVTINYIHRLFYCDIHLEGSISLFFITELHNFDSTSALNFYLLISEQNGCIKNIKLNSINTETNRLININKNETINYYMEIYPSDDWGLYNSIKRTYFQSLKNEYVFAYKFPVPSSITLLEIGCSLETGTSIYLSGFGIKQTDNSLYF